MLKARLIILRSEAPGCLVFVFEGDHDKSVYFEWTRRVRADLAFEPFPCGGKSQILGLRDSIDRELGEQLKKGIYFFIDRDFDDLRGKAADDRTFLTDRYSIENYLVSAEVLDALLKNEFHCHAQPKLRAAVVTKFEELYDQFLIATTEINFRVYAAKKLGIEFRGYLPTKIKDIAQVALLGVSPHPESPKQILLAHEYDAASALPLRKDFDALQPRLRFRGKFALLFFIRWLQHLAEDRARDAPILLKDVDSKRNVNMGQVTLSNLAAKSSLPAGFDSFIKAVTH